MIRLSHVCKSYDGGKTYTVHDVNLEVPAGKMLVLLGGQQQRVGFARALAAEPTVMLLDAPFGALDPETRDELRGEFLRLRKELGLTAVMVTHDMVEALLSADLLAVMEKSKLLQL